MNKIGLKILQYTDRDFEDIDIFSLYFLLIYLCFIHLFIYFWSRFRMSFFWTGYIWRNALLEVERGLYNTRNVCTLVEIGFDTGDEELAGRGGLTLTTGERLHVNYTQSISLNLFFHNSHFVTCIFKINTPVGCPLNSFLICNQVGLRHRKTTLRQINLSP